MAPGLMVSAAVGSVGATSARSGVVVGQERLQRQRAEPRVLGGVVDGVGREQVQHDGHVAEVEVEVDQGDLGAPAAEGDGQVVERNVLPQPPLS